jgi:hypothetical protein
MDAKRDDKFSKLEAKCRLEAALRGAFKTPPTPMKSIPPTRARTQPAKRKKAKGSA